MRVRIVDYVASQGGGARFLREVLGALTKVRPDIRIEIVSHSSGLALYRREIQCDSASISFREMKPRSYWLNGQERILGLRGSQRLVRAVGRARSWLYDVPATVFEGTDAVWLPWGNRHYVADRRDCTVVATIHDLIPLQQNLASPPWRAAERRSLARMVASGVRLVTVSTATARVLATVYPGHPETVVAHGDDHGSAGNCAPARDWQWSAGRFLLYPANISAHKNHETLIAAIAAWKNRCPLVLTGAGTDFIASNSGRGAELRTLAERLGLRIGVDLIPLGVVSEERYFWLLAHSWAVVISA